MVDISTRLIRAFLVVAEELNFTHAAAHLHIAQQTLSSQISQLEKLLGVTLLERTTRQVGLTPAGAHFRDEAPALLGVIEDTVDETRRVAGSPALVVRLGS